MTMISSFHILFLVAAATTFLCTLVTDVGAFAPITTTTSTSMSKATTTTTRQNLIDRRQFSPAFVGTVKENRNFALFMGWGPDPIWADASITSTGTANQSGNSVSVTINVSPETAQDYKIPGQYVQVRLNDDTKPLFLAIASAPDSENAQFEFLIKKTDDNGWMTDSPTGTSVQVSQVLGGGFPMAENLEGFKYDFPTQNVLLFAAGSGIAPIRAAIESQQLNVSGASGRTARLYYGVQSEADLCFVDSFASWENMGVQVVPVLSQPSPSWQGRTGYVQTAVEEDGVPVPRNSGALLCGMKGMAEAVKDVLTKAGVFEGRILTNF